MQEVYYHWLLSGDDWVRQIKELLPSEYKEIDMIRLLSSPLCGVVPRTTFQGLKLSPFASGRIISVRELPDSELSEEARKQKEFGRYSETAGRFAARDIEIEVDRTPDCRERHIIRSEGTVEQFTYFAKVRDEYIDTVFPYIGWETVEELWKRFEAACKDAEPLVSRDAYPNFPRFRFSGYSGSLLSDIFGLCATVLDHDLSNRRYGTSGVLRFLFTGDYYPPIGYEMRREYPYVKSGLLISGRCLLAVPAWAMPEDVAAFWRECRPSEARSRRMPTSSQLARFNFVLENTPPGQDYCWTNLASKWKARTGRMIGRDGLFKAFHSVRGAIAPTPKVKNGITKDSGVILEIDSQQANESGSHHFIWHTPWRL